MNYSYKVYTPDKKIIGGVLEATSEALAEEALYTAGYTRILNLEEKPEGIHIESVIPTFFGVKQREVVDFTNQLATLVESGVPLLTSLRLLMGQTRRKPFLKIMGDLIEEIKGGKPLSQAMSLFPEAFPDSYCQLVKAGEQAGSLETGLKQAVTLTERQTEATRKMKKAMRYPLMVIVVAIAVVALLVTVALPPLTSLYSSLGTELPWMTSLLLSMADFLTSNILVILLVIGILIVTTMALMRLESVRAWRDQLWLQLPVFGSLITERSVERFSRTTSMLLNAGLRLPAIMDIVIRSEPNRVLKQSFITVKERLVQGEGLARPISDTPVFPSLLGEMILVGESTGTIDAALANMAVFYGKKVDSRTDYLITMIEPVMTAVIGVVVIFIALSMITPLDSVMRSMY